MVCLKLFSNLIWLISINNIESETVSCYIYLQIVNCVHIFISWWFPESNFSYPEKLNNP